VIRRLGYAATVAAALAATPLICLLQWLAGIEWEVETARAMGCRPADA